MAVNTSDFLIRIKKLGSKDLSADNKYPQKKSINFIKAEEKQNSKIHMCMAVFGVVLLLVLGKFFVVDLVMGAMNQKENYEQMEERIEKLRELSASYDDVRDEYNRLGNGHLTVEEKSEMDRMEILDVIDRKIQSQAKIVSIDIQQNTAIVVMDGSSLQKVSMIAENVEKDNRVSYVSVSTAGSNVEGGKVTATLMITFKNGGVQ